MKAERLAEILEEADDKCFSYLEMVKYLLEYLTIEEKEEKHESGWYWVRTDRWMPREYWNGKFLSDKGVIIYPDEIDWTPIVRREP